MQQSNGYKENPVFMPYKIKSVFQNRYWLHKYWENKLKGNHTAHIHIQDILQIVLIIS